jgi:kumamolisin
MNSHLQNAGEPNGISHSMINEISTGEEPPLSNLKPLPGSEKSIPENTIAIGLPDPNEQIEITVILRSWPEDGNSAIKNFAQDNDLKVVRIDPDGYSVTLSGSIEALRKAFGVKLTNYASPRGNYLGYSGQVTLPGRLADNVLGVFGLDNRPLAYPYFFRLKNLPHITYTPNQMASLYDFDSSLDGRGQCIAIIEFGGGYREEDIARYFNWLKMSQPEIRVVSVDGADNQPGKDDDAEVVLDIDTAGAVVPGSRLVLYFAPNSERGFIDSINAVIHDKDNKPSVLSISWGAAEDEWSQEAIFSATRAFETAAKSNITVLCASGDSGSSDGENDSLAHVDFPASCPYVTGCGGTSFSPIDETVWNNGKAGGATGGGISDIFPLPTWQFNASVQPSANPGIHVGRGVPDVAGNSDPRTGYVLIYRGVPVVFGGTSVAAPLWAGLIAQINQGLKRPVGYLNPLLYTKLANSKALNDITSGNNSAYQAAPGWDACTGLGTPNGLELLRALMENLKSYTNVTD